VVAEVEDMYIHIDFGVRKSPPFITSPDILLNITGLLVSVFTSDLWAIMFFGIYALQQRAQPWPYPILSVFALFSFLSLFAVTLAALVDGVSSHRGSCGRLLERKEWYVALFAVVPH